MSEKIPKGENGGGNLKFLVSVLVPFLLNTNPATATESPRVYPQSNNQGQVASCWPTDLDCKDYKQLPRTPPLREDELQVPPIPTPPLILYQNCMLYELGQKGYTPRKTGPTDKEYRDAEEKVRGKCDKARSSGQLHKYDHPDEKKLPVENKPDDTKNDKDKTKTTDYRMPQNSIEENNLYKCLVTQEDPNKCYGDIKTY
jgi:hypothetical protein